MVNNQHVDLSIAVVSVVSFFTGTFLELLILTNLFYKERNTVVMSEYLLL